MFDGGFIDSILRLVEIGAKVVKLFGTVFFALCMFFLAYVFLAGTPIERINRGCIPVEWVGRTMTSAAALAGNGAEAKMEASAGEMFQGCRFFLFRQFYAKRLEQLRAQADAGKPASSVPAPQEATTHPDPEAP